MSDLETAVAKLREKLDGTDFAGSVKFEVEGTGAIMVDGDGVRIGEGEAEIVVKGDLDTFRDLFGGDLDPTQAFMTGRIEIEGEMAAAMQLVQYL
ncbi:MAG: SCP2 sterol-binding domain-containing protein [Pseudomonadota bacterium]